LPSNRPGCASHFSRTPGPCHLVIRDALEPRRGISVKSHLRHRTHLIGHVAPEWAPLGHCDLFPYRHVSPDEAALGPYKPFPGGPHSTPTSGNGPRRTRLEGFRLVPILLPVARGALPTSSRPIGAVKCRPRERLAIETGSGRGALASEAPEGHRRRQDARWASVQTRQDRIQRWFKTCASGQRIEVLIDDSWMGTNILRDQRAPLLGPVIHRVILSGPRSSRCSPRQGLPSAEGKNLSVQTGVRARLTVRCKHSSTANNSAKLRKSSP
jgi:hypothetical protein